MKRKLVLLSAIVMVLLSPVSAKEIKITVVIKKSPIVPIKPMIQLSCPKPYPIYR